VIFYIVDIELEVVTRISFLIRWLFFRFFSAVMFFKSTQDMVFATK
jgi:hypothetical protein